MDKQEIDELLSFIDDKCWRLGLMPLSVTVCHDDGAPSTAFLAHVAKHNLRQPGETDAQLVKRIAEIVQKDAKAGKYDWAGKGGA